MGDMVETYAGPRAWWEGISPTVRSRVILSENLTGAEMLEEASLNWTVSKRILRSEDPETGEYLEETGAVSDWVAVRRDSDNAFLGMVTPSYQPVQNDFLAEMADTLSGEGANLHTAGALFGGKLVWFQAVLDQELFITGDPSKYAAFLLITAGHDGRHDLALHNTPTRVVCWNTCRAAIAGAKASVHLRHTTNVANRLTEIRSALGLAKEYMTRFGEVANELTKTSMSYAEMVAFTEKLLPVNPEVEHAYRTEAQRKAIADLFSKSPTLTDVPFTAYRAFQAVAEYHDQVAPAKDTKKGAGADRRALSLIEGTGFDLKTAALKLLLPAAVRS